MTNLIQPNQITEPNFPPVAGNDSYLISVNNTLIIFPIGVLENDIDLDGDPLEANLVSDVTNGILNLASDGSFTYTPDPDFIGFDSFLYVANDGTANSNIAIVTILVVEENVPPIAQNDSYATNIGETLIIPAIGVLENDIDFDGDPLEANLVSDVSNGTLTLQSDGSFSYIPDAGFNGIDTFTYVANDGTNTSNVATVSIVVADENVPPVAQNDIYLTNVNEILTIPAIGVLENDTDADGDPLTANLVGDPSNGTVSLQSDGSFTYTPNTNFSGIDSFTYRASDGTNDSNVATVFVVVAQENTPPVARDDSYTTNQNQTLTIPAIGVLENDSDADGDTLTASVLSDVSNGTLNLQSDGSFTYTPDTGFSGTDTFTYIASDGNGGQDTASVVITVTPTGINIIEGTSGRDTLVGTDGDDLITGKQARDLITTGAGEDILVYNSIVDAGDIITDFEVGQDLLDFSELLDSFRYTGVDPIADGFIRINSAANDSLLSVDKDGFGELSVPRQFILFENVTPGELSNLDNFVL